MPSSTKVLTAEQKEKLGDLLFAALLEIRSLSGLGKSEQSFDLADAFHNLPTGMFREGFSLEIFRDDYLVPYQRKYPEKRPTDYVAAVTSMIDAS